MFTRYEPAIGIDLDLAPSPMIPQSAAAAKVSRSSDTYVFKNVIAPTVKWTDKRTRFAKFFVDQAITDAGGRYEAATMCHPRWPRR